MPAVLFKCPLTRQHVSGWLAEDVDALGNGETRAEAIKCIACSRVHLINPKTGKVFGPEEK
jgi:hypothetical protein